MQLNKFFILLILSLLFVIKPLTAQEKWTLTTNLQMNSGNYIFDSHMQNYYLYGGLAFKETNWGISANIPLIAYEGGSVSQFGNTFIPTQNKMRRSREDINGDSHHSGMGGGLLSDKEISIGDLYINGNYILINQESSFFDLFVNGYIKVPFADEELGLGTGKFDYSVSMGVRKNLSSFIFFAELGYLILGNSNEINYRDPLTYNIGIGSFLDNHNLGVLLTYNGYSDLIDGYAPPSQISLGIMLNSSRMMGYNISLSKGLSVLNPEYTISGGINFDF